MADKIRWGICSTGRIAGAFAQDVKRLPDAELVAVASRTAESAEAFGAQYDVPHRHASYEALAADPTVDVVYVASPHSAHSENTILFLNAGKAVLCEKPFCINATQARAMIDAARANNAFLMEAQWMYFLPALRAMQQYIEAGAIGDVRFIHADFCFYKEFDATSRIFDPALGGGALLDVGVYVLSLAALAAGLPTSVQSEWTPAPNGVDGQNALLCRFANGAIGLLSTAAQVAQPIEARIVGERGWIHLAEPFYKTHTLTIKQGVDAPRTEEHPLEGIGYGYEAQHVMDCLRAGRTESDVIPLAFSLRLMEILDEIRAGWGLKYPME